MSRKQERLVAGRPAFFALARCLTRAAYDLDSAASDKASGLEQRAAAQLVMARARLVEVVALTDATYRDCAQSAADEIAAVIDAATPVLEAGRPEQLQAARARLQALDPHLQELWCEFEDVG